MKFQRKTKLMLLAVCLIVIFITFLLAKNLYINTRPTRPVTKFEKQRNTFTLVSPNQKLHMIGNFSGFRFVINTNVCGEDKVDVLIVIGSHPGHHQLRNVLRQTIASPGIKGKVFKTVFNFGYLNNPDQQRLLEKESGQFGDIIQGNFLDSHRNVTLRDLMGFRWSWQYCPQARFIIRMDDDTSVDIYRLINVMEANSMQLTTSVGCFHVFVNEPVLRDGRYGLTKDDHPNDVFNPYCSGWMYVLTPQMAFNLDMASVTLKQYWMNDAYITGTVVNAIGAKPLSMNISATMSVKEMTKSMERWPPQLILGPTDGDLILILTFHEKYRKFAIETCSIKLLPVQPKLNLSEYMLSKLDRA